jgi:hypothetical protein
MQDDSDISYAEKPLGNPNNPSHALCPSCNTVKPIKHFKTKSTNAQAISWGYKKAIEITSDKCEQCRRPKKKISELSLKEIHNRIASGDIKGGAYGEMLKEDRHAEGIRKKREGVIKRWKDIRETAWDSLLRSSDKEHNRIRKAKSLLNQSTQDKPNGNTELMAFFTTYQTALNVVRSLFILEKKRGLRTPNKDKPWTYYVPKNTKDKLKELWSACPYESRLNMTHPAVISNTPQPTEGEEV